MSRRKHNLQNDRRPSPGFGQKVAATAGSLSALYLLPVVAQGAVIFVSGSPVSLTLGHTGPVTWSVDGNGGTFQLQGAVFGTAPSRSSYIALATGIAFKGRGFVVSSSSLRALHAGFTVGPTLKSYSWGTGIHRVLSGFNATSNFVASSFFGGAAGPNFIGFRFTGIDSQTHYGWADINLNLASGVVTIEDWAYNDVANAAIHVPEPSSLALLAIGAGGLAAFRRRKERNAAAVA
jgi:PEP-CTERM motif